MAGCTTDTAGMGYRIRFGMMRCMMRCCH